MLLTRRQVMISAAAITGVGTSTGCSRAAPSVTAAPSQPAPRLPAVAFPLRASANGRHLVDSDNQPFFLLGDSSWAMPVQLTNSQIELYLNDRRNRGFSGIHLMLLEHGNSSQTPLWNNVDGDAPFTSMSPINWELNEPYWQRVDYIANQSKARGMACVMFPAWFSYRANGRGWAAEIAATPASVLFRYGVALAARLSQGNIIWCMGGDYAGTAEQRAHQWNIAAGIRSIRDTDLITGHPERTEDTFELWRDHAGFNLNSIYTRYTDNNEYGEAADAWAKPGPLPFFNIESLYENENGFMPAKGRRQAYVSVLSGCCGFFFGNNPLWGFGDPRSSGGIGPARALATALDTVGAQDMTRMGNFFRSYPWHLLEPRTDRSLVTSNPGIGDRRLVAARATDGSLAMIWSRSMPFSVALSALTPKRLRARWFDPAASNYVAVPGSPFINAGQQTFAAPGDRVLVLDAEMI